MSEEETFTRPEGVPPGKIYADSINIYDDEARIALDYFKKAAEKIIAEEDRLDELKKKSDERCAELAKECSKLKTAFLIYLAVAVVALLLILVSPAPRLFFLAFIPAIIGFTKFIKSGKVQKSLDEQKAEGNRLVQEFKAIKRDYTISKLGVAYVPVATSVPFEEKSFILDDTGVTSQLEFSLYQMNGAEEFAGVIEDIKKSREELPMVESGEAAEDVPTAQLSGSLESVRLHDYIGTIDRQLRSASYLLNDLTKTSVSLPVVDPKSEYSAFLRDFCTEDAGAYPTLGIFEQRTYSDELKRFEELNETRKRMAAENAKLEKILQEFIVDVSDYVQLMGRAKLTSTNKLVDYSNTLLLNTFKASYNHYSTVLESEEIKRIQEDEFNYRAGETEHKPFSMSPASRVRFDPVSSNWVAEDGGRTSFPFGIHQIQEEIIAPLVQNLLKETRTERLRIYNDIMNQKRDYLNRWNDGVQDFYGRGRAERNSIMNEMQNTLTELNAALSQYAAYESAEKSMSSSSDDDLETAKIKASTAGTAFSIASCNEQRKEIERKQEEFNDAMERLAEDIARREEQFNYTKYYDASLRDGHARDVAVALLAAKDLDERQKMLLSANAYIASNAHLPPEPAVDASVYGTLGMNLNEVVRQTLADLESQAAISRSVPEDEAVAGEDEGGSTGAPGDAEAGTSGEL